MDVRSAPRREGGRSSLPARDGAAAVGRGLISGARSALRAGVGLRRDDAHAGSVQAAENHNSSRSNRTNTIAAPGGNDPGGGNTQGQIDYNSSRSNVKVIAPADKSDAKKVGVKEEGVKSK